MDYYKDPVSCEHLNFPVLNDMLLLKKSLDNQTGQ